MITYCAICGKEILGDIYRHEGFPICGICKIIINHNADTAE